MITVRVQSGRFDLAHESALLTRSRTDVGALATFIGLVRGSGDTDALTLEHYPAMTEKALTEIAAAAEARFPLLGLTLIHRHGRLIPGDPIVMVAVAAAHRAPAFEACEFLMDYLKTRAPFWKKEEVAGSARWVETRAEDDAQTARWKE